MGIGVRVFLGFSGFFIFFRGFGLREAFHWIRSAILTHPDLSRAREDLSRPVSDIFWIFCFFEHFFVPFLIFLGFWDSEILRKRRAAQFRAGSTDSQAEINFLDLFREGRRFLLFDPFGRPRRRRRRRLEEFPVLLHPPSTRAGGKYPRAGEPLTPAKGVC